jgi:hypothetical protein
MNMLKASGTLKQRLCEATKSRAFWPYGRVKELEFNLRSITYVASKYEHF